MDDTISRHAAMEEISKQQTYKMFEGEDALYLDANDVGSVLASLPSAQPERKKGKWQITDAYPHNVYCSECHKRFAQTHWGVWEDGSLPRNFCPNCGAKMEEGVV